jgi:hypothetical protein
MSLTYGLGYLIPLGQGQKCFESIFEFSERSASEITIRYSYLKPKIDQIEISTARSRRLETRKKLGFVKFGEKAFAESLNEGLSRLGARYIDKSEILETSVLLSDNVKALFDNFLDTPIEGGNLRFLLTHKTEDHLNEISFDISLSNQFFEKMGYFVLEVGLPTFGRRDIPVNPEINRLILEITKILNPYCGFTYADGIESIINSYFPSFPSGYGGNIAVFGKRIIEEYDFMKINWKSHLDKIYEFHDLNGTYVFFGPDYIGNQDISIIGHRTEGAFLEYEHDQFLEKLRDSYNKSHYKFLEEQIFSKLPPFKQVE